MTDIQHATLTWDTDGQPVSREYGDVYFSRSSGIEETHHVFLKHNQLPNRWTMLGEHQPFTIAETGFGTGLNFFVTCDLWQKTAPKTAMLHFVSVEKSPLLLDDMVKALSLWPDLQTVAAPLLAQYSLAGPGFYRFHLPHNIHLTLIIGDALEGLQALLPHPHPGPQVSASNSHWGPFLNACGRIDAWFLDGFAPAKNPDMWSPALFETLHALSAPDATFATYTASGVVRRGLESAGFDVKKTAGFGQKRDMLCGKARPKSRRPNDKPEPSWHLQPVTANAAKSVAVIGAGLSGAHTARSLAEKGFAVTVFEAQGVAAGASGNPQGALYTKLSPLPGPLADFNASAFHYACRHYRQLGLFEQAGSACGVLQLAASPTSAAQYPDIAQRYPTLCQWVTPQQAREVAGVDIALPALYFANSGWLRPIEVCNALLRHPNINLKPHSKVTDLTYKSSWTLLCNNVLHKGFDAVVIASANEAKQLHQCAWLTTKSIRGQITQVTSDASSLHLKTVLCGEGYIAPAWRGQHCLGATFTLNNQDSNSTPADSALNFRNATALSPNFEHLAQGVHTDRVSFRCTTPDYLPMVGPVPMASRMIERFAKYRHNFKHTIDAPGHYWPGLFMNLGHGSRGLTYAPLCAELLSNMITGVPLPLPQSLALHLHSARFLMRDLARNRL